MCPWLRCWGWSDSADKDRWDPESGKVLISDYFAKRDDKEFDFIADFWKRQAPLAPLRSFNYSDREADILSTLRGPLARCSPTSSASHQFHQPAHISGTASYLTRCQSGASSN